VLAARSTELLSLAGVLLLVLAGPGAVVWAPLALAVGPVLAAAVLRAGVLVPIARRPAAADAAPTPEPAVTGTDA
jgi:hypothetical protein